MENSTENSSTITRQLVGGAGTIGPVASWGFDRSTQDQFQGIGARIVRGPEGPVDLAPGKGHSRLQSTRSERLLSMIEEILHDPIYTILPEFLGWLYILVYACRISIINSSKYKTVTFPVIGRLLRQR